MDITLARALARDLSMAADEAEAAGRTEVDLAALQARLAARADKSLDELQAAIDAARNRGG